MLDTLEVADGGVIDYSLIDTSRLYTQVDKYTQIRFAAWDSNPKTATKDLTIQALSEIGVIEMVHAPEKKYYFNKNGSIDLGGLQVSITLATQTPEFDSSGNRVVTHKVVDIAETCRTVPVTLNEAFADSKTCIIEIYPLESVLPIYDYKITLLENLGDPNADGTVNAIDASFVLTYYAKTSVGIDVECTEEQAFRSDIDRNGALNAIDASFILTYYAQSAVGAKPQWEQMLNF